MLKAMMVAVLGTVVGVGPVAAGTGSASLAGVQVDYTIADAYFDGPGCAPAAWTLTYVQPADIDFDVLVTVGTVNDPDPLQDAVLVETFGPTTATESGTFCIENVAAPLQAGGTLTVRDADFEDIGQTPLSSAAVRVVQNPTRFAKATVRRTAVRGMVVADTRTKGTLGADGQVRIFSKRKGTWSQIGAALPNDDGTFRSALTRKVKKGKTVRVQLTECQWCSDLTKTIVR